MNMLTDEMKAALTEYLKENLAIEVSARKEYYSYDGMYAEIKVSVRLAGEVISTSHDSFSLPD